VKPLRREPSDEGSDRRLYQQRIKTTPTAEEVELYNVTIDPMELDNLAGKWEWKEREAAPRQLLAEQCAQKRLTPSSGAVPGETCCRDA
jgi:choline-sulfatase